MVATPKRALMTSHRSVGGANTQSLLIWVNDVEAHFALARAAGAKIIKELETKNYGDDYRSNRGYRVEDLERSPVARLRNFA
jgi:uncharacterized glyoxalase superfamily protein PhnB